MSKEEAKLNYYKKVNVSKHGGAGGLWFLGFVGTLVYFLHVHSGSFKLVVLAFIKAIFWVPVMVYYLLRFMKI